MGVKVPLLVDRCKYDTRHIAGARVFHYKTSKITPALQLLRTGVTSPPVIKEKVPGLFSSTVSRKFANGSINELPIIRGILLFGILLSAVSFGWKTLR
jgi:hypothetical protein